MNHKIQKSRFQKKYEWSDDDKRYLLKWAGKKPIQEIGKALNRKSVAIANQAGKIGVKIAHKDNVWT